MLFLKIFLTFVVGFICVLLVILVYNVDIRDTGITDNFFIDTCIEVITYMLVLIVCVLCIVLIWRIPIIWYV